MCLCECPRHGTFTRGCRLVSIAKLVIGIDPVLEMICAIREGQRRPAKIKTRGIIDVKATGVDFKITALAELGGVAANPALLRIRDRIVDCRVQVNPIVVRS